MDRWTWQATVHRVARVRHDLVAEPLPIRQHWLMCIYQCDALINFMFEREIFLKGIGISQITSTLSLCFITHHLYTRREILRGKDVASIPTVVLSKASPAPAGFRGSLVHPRSRSVFPPLPWDWAKEDLWERMVARQNKSTQLNLNFHK